MSHLLKMLCGDPHSSPSEKYNASRITDAKNPFCLFEITIQQRMTMEGNPGLWDWNKTRQNMF